MADLWGKSKTVLTLLILTTKSCFATDFENPLIACFMAQSTVQFATPTLPVSNGGIHNAAT
ncbi:hypothetical protein TUN199_08488 [Pyrenophora tritici-repentis]|uniref:Uncharacterized protein n=1 Tax=Pyrenophora tritici-repentis TaxID=45151 RepID=A0A5M9LNN9_9PLEO|nr:hypothetical protein PtrV1_01235 [Pyrenophora tritici-repentis]KAF7577053.1 hypothetical protein PtrM4_012930 [Pyrenophora tritici-repentis]KAI0577269.1 hypothetical protein Alg130_08448 [Pyrenophora tritici-repentis]KAI0578371.1 hypothetical protein Alg215_06377 [Pyrenophora tritici-repentis]KAI0607313.1 hypothetical protein TUN205_08437 [Pyrenophora tritici-repentis]